MIATMFDAGLLGYTMGLPRGCGAMPGILLQGVRYMIGMHCCDQGIMPIDVMLALVVLALSCGGWCGCCCTMGSVDLCGY